MLFEVENFQSIQKASFDLSKFVAIVGPTNRGKSAVIRALRVMLYNEWNGSYLRLGASECRLGLIFSEEESSQIHKVYLEKPRNTYQVYYRDGSVKTYPKVGIETPEELKALGFKVLRSERDDKFNLNFQGQLDPLFLVGQSEVEITSFFNSVFKVTRFERALKSLNADALKLRQVYDADGTRLTAARGELAQSKEALAAEEESRDQVLRMLAAAEASYQRLNELDQSLLRLAGAGRLQELILELSTNLTLVERFQSALRTLLEKVSGIQGAQLKVESLQRIEAGLGVTRAVRTTVGMVAAFLEAYAGVTGRCLAQSTTLSRFRGLELVTQQIRTKAASLSGVCAFLESYQQKVTALGSLRYYTESLTNLEVSLAALDSKIRVLGKIQGGFTRTRAASEAVLTAVGAMQAQSGALRRLQGELTTLRARQAGLEEAASGLSRYRQDFFTLVGKCPTCGGDLGGHNHD